MMGITTIDEKEKIHSNLLDHLAGYKYISAENLLDKLGFSTPPFDPFEIGSKLGIEILLERISGHPESSGKIALERLDEGIEIKVWINPYDHSNRQRFTMAHELGHLVNDIIPHAGQLNVDDSFIDNGITLHRDGRQDPKEYAANDFAANLLMPEFHVIKFAAALIKKYKNDNNARTVPTDYFVDQMKDIFDVSRSAMTIRLKSIGILPN